MPQSENSSETPENASEVISAISENDVVTLEGLLDSCPALLSVLDEDGNNLLQLSIILNRYETFSYLLSLNFFDLEVTNNYKETALVILLTRKTHNGSFFVLREYYAVDLVDKGANIYTICYDNNTFLHLVLMRHQLKTAQILIEKGADLNAQNDSGCTPLHMLFHTYWNSDVVTEGVGLMLYYNADVSICDNNGFLPFDLAVLYDSRLVTAQEDLFYYTFDSYSQHIMPADTLFELLETESFLFHQVVDVVSEVFFLEGEFFCSSLFFEINSEFLRVMIEKFDYVLKKLFLSDCPLIIPGYEFPPIFNQNWEILLHSHLASDTIEFIGHLTIKSMICKCKVSPKVATEFIFYLLTYGLKVSEQDLDCVYKAYGYYDLFKTLLFMDITKCYFRFSPSCDIVPRIIFDINCDLDTFLGDPSNNYYLDALREPFSGYSLDGLEKLLDYFARPNLKTLCYKLGVKKLTDKAEKLPQVPHLLELARDSTRQYLRTNYNLKNTKDFYSVLNWLPISVIYKRILSFETKLYR